jgi:cyclopropane fatty-acyl-phospholipid synthase-like methyltransferase
MADAAVERNQFTAFWNNVLVAKFERFRNVLLDGLSYHSQVPLAKLDLQQGAKVLDVGCGWGDTAIQLAQMVGPSGRRLASTAAIHSSTRGARTRRRQVSPT